MSDRRQCVPKTSSVLIWESNRAACLLVGHQADVPTHLMYVSAFEGGTGSAWSSWALRSVTKKLPRAALASLKLSVTLW